MKKSFLVFIFILGFTAGIFASNAEVILPLKVNDNPSTKITIYLLDTGLVLSRLDITK
jgi:hypothetical protein